MHKHIERHKHINKKIIKIDLAIYEMELINNPKLIDKIITLN